MKLPTLSQPFISVCFEEWNLCLSGPQVVLVGSTALLFSQKPLLLYNGELTCQTASGKTNNVPLSTHSFLKRSTDTLSAPQLSQQLSQAIMLKRWDGLLTCTQNLHQHHRWCTCVCLLSFYWCCLQNACSGSKCLLFLTHYIVSKLKNVCSQFDAVVVKMSKTLCVVFLCVFV